MEYPPYSPDLAPCDFFLFGAMKQVFAWQHFDTIEDFLLVWKAFYGLFTDRFQEWVRRLQLYREGGKKYVE
jgi:hypothetical protein